jgi:signal transduction histidine kinase
VPTDTAEFPKRGSFGLLGLHEGAMLIAADFKIQSSPGVGTSVIIKVMSESDSF